MQETSATTYRKEFSSMPSATGAKSGIRITVEVVDIPDEQYNVFDKIKVQNVVKQKCRE